MRCGLLSGKFQVHRGYFISEYEDVRYDKDIRKAICRAPGRDSAVATRLLPQSKAGSNRRRESVLSKRSFRRPAGKRRTNALYW